MEEKYNDGWTMEEQRQLKKSKTLFLGLTEKFQAESADKLISKLKQELGAANAYIQELEESAENSTDEWKQAFLDLQEQYKELQEKKDKKDKKYLNLKKEYEDFKLGLIDKDLLQSYKDQITSYQKKVSELEGKIRSLKVTRDYLISRMNNGGNI